MLRVGASLHRSDANPDRAPRVGSKEDWAAIDWDAVDAGADPESLVPCSLEDAKGWLANYVNECLEWASVAPHLHRSSGQPEVQLRGWTTFSYIAAQLLFFVAGGKETAHCVECGELYVPKRKPRADRRNYCRRCRKAGVPWRDSKRDQRARAANKTG